MHWFHVKLNAYSIYEWDFVTTQTKKAEVLSTLHDVMEAEQTLRIQKYQMSLSFCLSSQDKGMKKHIEILRVVFLWQFIINWHVHGKINLRTKLLSTIQLAESWISSIPYTPWYRKTTLTHRYEDMWNKTWPVLIIIMENIELCIFLPPTDKDMIYAQTKMIKDTTQFTY